MLPSASASASASASTPAARSEHAVAAGTDAALDRLERQFGVLYAAYRQRFRDQSAAVDPTLQPSGYRTLVQLVLDGPIAAGELAEALGFDKSVLSRQLHHLESLGLVSRDRDPADRRSIIISPTAEAVDRVNRVRRDARDAFRNRLSRWSPDEIDELHRLLGNLL